MIISIAGTPGSGKTTIAELLARKLNYKSYYLGALRRKMAQKKGMTLDEYNKYGETHAETDQEIDQYQKELGQKEDNFVIQGRTSYHFIPHSYKIFLKCKLEEGAKRILDDIKKNRRDNETEYKHLRDAIAGLTKRIESDKKRYQQYYQVNPFNEKNYDLVVDTTNLTIQEVLQKVYENIEKELKKRG